MASLTRLHILGGGSIGQLIAHAAGAHKVPVTMLVRPTQMRKEMLQAGVKARHLADIMLGNEPMAQETRLRLHCRFSMPYNTAEMQR
jgi:ketopantoate reductase